MTKSVKSTVCQVLLLACASSSASQNKTYPVALKIIETDAISYRPDGSRTTTTCTVAGPDTLTCDSNQVPASQRTQIVSFADGADGNVYMISCLQGAGARFAQGFAAGTGAATVTGCFAPPGTYKARWDGGRLKILHEKNGRVKEATFAILASTPISKEGAQKSSPRLEETVVAFSSAPLGADIEIDGKFVGQTPSSIPVPPGEHSIKISKGGYEQWDRKISTSGGEITVSADLERVH